MITNFEEETSKLSEDELKQVPLIIQILKNIQQNSPIKSEYLCIKFNNEAEKIGLNHITGVRLRKITNYIRSSSLLPIIATSKGYYCSYDKNLIKSQIKSLMERADAIKNSARGLEHFLNEETQLNLF